MSLKAKAVAIWKDESAQGATEYILILVAVVTVAFIFKTKITEFIKTRMGNLGEGLGKFDANSEG